MDEARENIKPIFDHPEKLSTGRTNGKHRKIRRSREEITGEINDLITEIADQGIVIQDIYRGLIDFPAFIQGDEAFLCYELADGDSILYWHSLDSGYAGRQPIPDGMP